MQEDECFRTGGHPFWKGILPQVLFMEKALKKKINSSLAMSDSSPNDGFCTPDKSLAAFLDWL